jgi:hypothetical protein
MPINRLEFSSFLFACCSGRGGANGTHQHPGENGENGQHGQVCSSDKWHLTIDACLFRSVPSLSPTRLTHLYCNLF